MSASAIFSLDEFKSSSVGHFASGAWGVEYYDRTHLDRNEKPYILLGEIKIEEVAPDGEAIFSFRPTPKKQENEQNGGQASEEVKYLETLFKEAWEKGTVQGDKNSNSKKAAKVIFDQLGESMARLGLIQPTFDIDPPGFAERKFAVVILDTSALRDGAIRHLKEQFYKVQLWAIIPTVSLMEIGERVAYMTKMDRGGCKAQNSGLIRLRPQVTVIPQEIKWIKENFPTETLELAPELLRTFHGYEARQDDKEPDRVSINDRLILECIKDLRRQRGLLEGIYLISGDKDMSRLARLEGIHTIYPALPSLQEFPNGIYSIRYSPEARTYISCSIHRFLWDLTHVFSRTRIRCLSGSQAGRIVELFYYFPTKLVNDWVDDKLEVTDFGPDPVASAV